MGTRKVKSMCLTNPNSKQTCLRVNLTEYNQKQTLLHIIMYTSLEYDSCQGALIIKVRPVYGYNMSKVQKFSRQKERSFLNRNVFCFLNDSSPIKSVSCRASSSRWDKSITELMLPKSPLKSTFFTFRKQKVLTLKSFIPITNINKISECLDSNYLLLLQWLNDLCDAHLQVFDVVPLGLQKLLDDFGPLFQHPQLRILTASTSGGGHVQNGGGVHRLGLR